MLINCSQTKKLELQSRIKSCSSFSAVSSVHPVPFSNQNNFVCVTKIRNPGWYKLDFVKGALESEGVEPSGL